MEDEGLQVELPNLPPTETLTWDAGTQKLSCSAVKKTKTLLYQTLIDNDSSAPRVVDLFRNVRKLKLGKTTC